MGIQRGLKSGLLNAKVVAPDRKLGDTIDAGIVGFTIISDTALARLGRDRSTHNGGAARIGDGTCDRGGKLPAKSAFAPHNSATSVRQQSANTTGWSLFIKILFP